MDITDAARTDSVRVLEETNQADLIDRQIAQWREERPKLDPTPLALVGRIMSLAEQFRLSLEGALVKHGITLAQYDILSTLRRHGKKHGMPITHILESVTLANDDMAQRLDVLVDSGYVARKLSGDDRRMVVFELTSKGRRVVDYATSTHFESARRLLPPVTELESAALTEMLRRWLAAAAG